MRRRGVEYCCALAIKVSERWRIPETTIWTLSSLVHCTSLSALHCTTLLLWVGPQCTVAVYLGAFYHKLLKSAMLSSASHRRKDLHPCLHFNSSSQHCTAICWMRFYPFHQCNVSPTFCKRFIGGQKKTTILVTPRDCLNLAQQIVLDWLEQNVWYLDTMWYLDLKKTSVWGFKPQNGGNGLFIVNQLFLK